MELVLRRIAGVAAILAALMAVAAVVWFVCFSPYRVYVVHTGSMSPTIPVRSAEIVRVGQYRIGQVVSFRYSREVITHRLIGIAPNGMITTKGDANATADPWHVPTSNIIGQVVAAPRYLGWWLVFFRQPSTYLSVIVTLFMAWFVSDWLKDSPAPPTRHAPRHRRHR